MRSIIATLTLLFLTQIVYSQNNCQNTIYYNRSILKQDNYKATIINNDTFFVFNQTNRTYPNESDAPDTSILDGTWLLMAANDSNKILLQVSYKNKLRDGKLICKTNEGVTLEERNYKNGKLDGKYLDFFYENGQLSRESSYVNGVVDGDMKMFFRDGKLSYHCFYISGKIQGDEQGWWKNRKLRQFGHYENGLKQGEFYEWDEKNRITEYALYKDDKSIGASFKFYEGKLTSEQYFANGKLIREVLDYYDHPKGYFQYTSKKKIEYDFNQIERAIKKEAVLVDTIIYINSYYPSGKLKSEEPQFYFGEIDCKKVYHKTGAHKFYAEDGKLVKELVYKDDILITK